MLAKSKRKKNRGEEKVFQILFSIFSLVLVGFLIISNLKIDRKRKELTEKIKALTEEIQILEEKKEELKAGISQTEKESYWEERIREQGYMKEGEEAVVIKQVGMTEEKETEGKNLWQKFIEEIKNLLRD